MEALVVSLAGGICGMAAAVAGLVVLGWLVWRRERTALPLVLLALGLLGFLFLGFADLPLIIRYLLVPASMLALFAGEADEDAVYRMRVAGQPRRPLISR